MPDGTVLTNSYWNEGIYYFNIKIVILTFMQLGERLACTRTEKFLIPPLKIPTDGMYVHISNFQCILLMMLQRLGGNAVISDGTYVYFASSQGGI